MKAVAGDGDIAGSGFLPVGVNHPEADREVGHDQGAPDDERRDTATSGGKKHTNGDVRSTHKTIGQVQACFECTKNYSSSA